MVKEVGKVKGNAYERLTGTIQYPEAVVKGLKPHHNNKHKHKYSGKLKVGKLKV
jgi:hypothetical protein